ncbi:hypothetical protein TPHA_0B01245 [Tetrapisispora phaffii CBS 4417]|uniref:Ty3 transposon capsid-like protein domain-containing protein n=1 Tax=Tetrapisispora phaffii (strain ATCC 24235 / CBS 4417 / NBRC 1672 / NRRL Y-8282 / UCD 70-5) TaxID=1071381 RepID=G8BP66_TETPH|nr:hypothetical protein TPHA_0B01245 [Tetrapisispora phaffii CBS 4417]CCE61797.1 hypothetical protein TPHA_0B01245 [Tetrapisispora phaffii CBS 4417]
MYIVAPNVSPKLLKINDLYDLRSMIFKVNLRNDNNPGLTNYKRICQVAQNFEGELLDWYIMFHEQNASILEEMTFDEFLEELKKFISTKPVMQQLYDNYYDVDQCGSVEEYNAEFYRIIFFLSREYFTEISLISRYLNGLKKVVKEALINLSEQPSLLAEVMNVAKTQETIVQNQIYQSYIIDTDIYREYQHMNHDKEQVSSTTKK